MTTPSPSPPPRQILITPYPFNSAVSATLAQALDDELEAMYPDWDTLPHPGFTVGKVGGDSLVTTTGNEGEGGGSRVDAGNPVPALTALDADADADRVEAEAEAETEAEVKKLNFFVAFDVTDQNEVDQRSEHGSSGPSTTATTKSSSSSLTGHPIGCIGVKLMPYFPHHRPPPPPSSPPSTSPEEPPTTTTTTTIDPTCRYAEIKRLYIAPSHRGISTTITTTTTIATTPGPTLSPSAPVHRLADRLVEVATEFAATKLHATNLVLETGVRQHAAVKLYHRLGWRSRPEYGDYVGAGEGEGGVSRCFEFVVGGHGGGLEGGREGG